MTVTPAHYVAFDQLHRRRWRIKGRVQGVGFRPFIYRIASNHNLTGFVLNDGDGVTVEAQGDRQHVDQFGTEIEAKKPVLATIQELTVADQAIWIDEHEFVIRDSVTAWQPTAEIAPDVAICADCLRELRDPADKRRFGHGLINCTSCGPRFSIVRNVPYDRHNTTMAPFAMCEKCRAEYSNPADRRFHAQPTACNSCGPKVEFVDSRGLRVKGDAIEQAAKLLWHGKIVAIKGMGGFHLAVSAEDEAAVSRLRNIKHRAYKPFAVMTADVT